GTPLLGAFTLRAGCVREVRKTALTAACGFNPSAARVSCCEFKPANGKMKGAAKRATKCVDSPTGAVIRHACYVSPFAVDACSSHAATTNGCRSFTVQETANIPSGAQPLHTPGSSGVVVTNPKLVMQFGGSGFSLNNARYTRHRLAGPEQQP